MRVCENADRQPARVLICSHSGWSPKGRLYHLSVTEKGITAVLILDHKSHSRDREEGKREGARNIGERSNQDIRRTESVMCIS